MKRFKMIASGYVLFIRNKQILLLRRQNTGYMDGKYSLPAGHIENNESITQGTIREIAEETGVKLLPKNVKLIHVMHRKETDIRMDFFFLAKKIPREPKNFETQKCDQLKWVPLNKLPNNTIPYIKTAINNYRKQIFFSEFGWKI